MAAKKDPTAALVAVVKALDPLEAADRQWVLQSAANKWTINLSQAQAGAGAGGTPGGGGAGAGTPAELVKDAKRFLIQKDPKSDLQRIACLAYYLTHGKATPQFKTRDLTTAHTDSKGPKFHLPRAVGNAARTKCGYLSAVGGGKKQLTSYGELVVEALPDQEAVKALELKHKKRGGGRKKSRKTKR
jgi:hypothetical protein